jgi:alpha,alpha-trehalose phosphorylase
MQLAYDYFGEAALVDLSDLARNARDGLHMASLAGTWLAVTAGFGGFRDHGGQLTFAPRLPPALSRISFKITFRGDLLQVEIGRNDATYTLTDGNGEGLEFLHYGDIAKVETGSPIKLPIPELEEKEAPKQPAGRAPAPRLPR